ncbi:MAG: hypothetical protein OXL34_12065 [Gemmatimonadota bacterium]|nr:hypothetical protein [Gemmatimonadota bacterium]
MSERYDSPLAPEQIGAVKDEDIDFSDIPELDEDFWKRAELVQPDSQYPVAGGLGDLLLTGAKMVDSPVSTLIDMVQHPLKKRQARFIQRLAERLHRLEKNQIDTEKLASAIAEVQQTVLASQVENQERLVNATVNSALSRTLGESDRKRYMNYLGFVGEWHFRILALLRNPPRTNVMSLSALIQEQLGDIDDDELTRVWSELYRERMVTTESPHGMMSSSGVSTKRTTPFGDRFLRFVSHSDPDSASQPRGK